MTNRWIKDFSHLGQVFSTNVAGFEKESSTNYYRPLMYVAYMATYKIARLNPLLYHMVNVLFHACASLLVLFIARRIPWPSSASSGYLSVPFLSAIIFATHPIHSEAVIWVAALPDVAFSTSYLLSFYFYISGRSNGPLSTRAYVLSLAFYFVAAFFKEPAVTLPLFLLAYDIAFRKPRSKLPWRLYALYGTVTAMYFAARYYALGGVAPQTRYADLTSWQMIINTLPLFGEYLRLFLLPVNLNAFHIFRPLHSLADPKFIISATAVVALAAAAFLSYKKNKSVFLCLAVFLIPLLPAFYLPALGENPSADRYLYLPSAGLAMLTGYALSYAASRLSRRLTLAFAALLFITYSYGTVARTPVWENDLTLWADTVTKSSDSATTHKYYGYALYKYNKLDEAISEYRKSLAINGKDSDTHLNLGVAYALQGRHDSAVNEFIISLSIKPSALAEVNLGLELMKVGEFDQAMQLCRSAAGREPYSSSAHNCVGSILGNAGIYEEAAREFETALALDPANSMYAENLEKARQATINQSR